MAEIFENIIMVLLAFGAGFLLSENKRQKEETKTLPPEEARVDFVEEKSKTPSLMRQMINIMNYNGEEQREENYD
ncbi:MAG: hypothetical protein IKL57_07770 [Oscillospiraceae bacterium]|nr:hypothetical protein [Oscillospiraceae bacterium]